MLDRLLPAVIALIATPALAATDTIRLGMVLEPPGLDPTANAAAAIDEVVYANLFEGLTRFAPDGTIVPGLALEWQAKDNGAVYEFRLRQGVTFHDGATFDASDVVFSLDRARAEDSTNAQKQLFAGITGVEAVEPDLVRVTLDGPDGSFPWKMAWGDAVILDPASAAQAATAPVGTGPFRLGEWTQGDHITLEAFDGYWGDKPALRSATFRFIPDPTAAFAAMMAGDVDAFPIYPAPETLPQLAADPRFKVIVGTTEGETILSMNNRHAPLDDPRVRKAIALAVDRQAIIDGAMFGHGTPISSHFAPHHPDYVDLLDRSPHDPDRARTLLAEAGVSGLTLRLALPPPPYARRGGEIVAAQLRAVGIETRITNMEWAQWLETVFRGADFDLTIISHVEPMDIDIYAREGYYIGYDNPTYRDVIGRFTASTDPAERSALLKQAQEMLAEDSPAAFLFQLAKPGVADARIEGLWQNAPTPANDLTKVRWVE
ncbi:ABC transporter substrate-binding protein [Paracoccus sp. MC1862]|uniref:ABC transporter substrate-binding protein n=1 Tax=Paracoccus sp. MC1862 TaxID=2760307 RepID=UPI001602CD90|nr:ABC transporter substrate-binding protein [Paracoccus sp. MC1862]MBB1497081.1 ABC transporter substrate-binding protein [Paracoccus sp. MC1862]QQO44519.1 ABC transporter substrate-binding protein [Paracoccus sp. MC1862]